MWCTSAPPVATDDRQSGVVILGGMGSVWGVIVRWLNVEGLAVIGDKSNDTAGTNLDRNAA